ncbi:MAG: methylmalonyl-CoA epimerase [Acidaminococcales bacterium]|jgi:methylmalonyl-CoA/ethylmalonyl-CoA epimerase|nr:methylmalonyl-CoA epimerase [Acidaminococcales bacterium]
MSFKVLCIDHIGIGVKNLDATKKLYQDTFGIQPLPEDEIVAPQKVKVSFFPLGPAGELEFLESTEPDGPIGKFMADKGETAIQHVALRVDDIGAALADLEAKGVRLIDKKPRYGAAGSAIAFLHPKSTPGILVEICERKPHKYKFDPVTKDLIE